MVPTVDTVRVKFIASSLVRAGVHTLLVGGVGVGKTMMASSVMEGLPAGYGAVNINFSAQTSSNSLQDTIEGKLEKRTKVVSHLQTKHPMLMSTPVDISIADCQTRYPSNILPLVLV